MKYFSIQSSPALVFTVAEVARLLRAVDGRDAFTARAIRYHARTGVLEPSGRAHGARGARLYTLADVAFLRFAWHLLHRCKVSERATWGLLVYRGVELRAKLASRTGDVELREPVALSRGVEDPRGAPASVVVPVATVWAGLTQAADRLRRLRPRVWTGSAWVMPADVAAWVVPTIAFHDQKALV